MIYKILFIGHLIGAFYVQTDRVIEKKECFRLLLKHCIRYFLTLLICGICFVKEEERSNFIILIMNISIFHGFFNFLKMKLDNASRIPLRHRYIWFLVDQLMHIGILIAMTYLIGIKGVQEIKILGASYDYVFWSHKLIGLIGILICGKPAAIIVKEVFTIIETKDKKGKKGDTQIGALIGILEREIILILGILGQFGAIGFVLAAKSLARYKQLESQKFAEKYIVGTLLSCLISMVCVAMYYYLW